LKSSTKKVFSLEVVKMDIIIKINVIMIGLIIESVNI